MQAILFKDGTIGQEVQHTHTGDALLQAGVVLYRVELGYCLHPGAPLQELKSLSVLVFFIWVAVHAPTVTDLLLRSVPLCWVSAAISGKTSK